jgi:hypothetical protein
MSLRVGYFLAQGIALSVAGIDRPVARPQPSADADAVPMETTQDSTQASSSPAASTAGLNPASVIGALADAILSDDIITETSAVVTDVAAPIVGDIQRELFSSE